MRRSPCRLGATERWDPQSLSFATGFALGGINHLGVGQLLKQGGIDARRLKTVVFQGRGAVPTRFGGVGVWRVYRNSAVFLRSWDRGYDDAVVFPEIGEDGYFDHRGADVHALRNTSKQMLAVDRVFHRREVL